MYGGSYGLQKKKYLRRYRGQKGSYKFYSSPYSGSLVPRFTQKAYKRRSKIKSDLQTVKISYDDKIILPAGFNTYAWSSNSASFLNLTSILVNASEFTTRTAQYSYYKLNGISVKFTRRWLNSLGAGDNATPGFQEADLGLGLPMLSVNFYPNQISTVLTNYVANADTHLSISPFITETQTYWVRFPRNFSQGISSQGLGTWNPCNAVSSLSGQLSVENDGQGVAASSFGYITIFDVEIEVYANFCNNTGA